MATAYFTTSANASLKLTRRQRVEEGKVGDDRGGLPESADRIFRPPPVDTGLAADARVHHRQQSRRDLDHANPALPDRCTKAGEVPDRPSSHCDYAAGPVHVLALEEAEHIAQRGQGLGALTGWNHVDWRLHAGALDRLGDLPGP